MKALNLITLLLVIVGALNWAHGPVPGRPCGHDLRRPQATLSRIVYSLVGLSGLYQLVPFFGARAAITTTRSRSAPRPV